MGDDLEAGLRARFTVREEAFAHGGWRVDLVLPRAADELIDPGDFDRDERLPYWADLWPSARALARHLLEVEYDAAGGALELGCGVALPSLALRGRGVDVLATDWYADALRFAKANAARNGLGPLRTALLDWRHPPEGERYALVVAADVLYEQRNADALAALLPRITAPGGTVLVADPGRVYARGFRNEMTLAGWSVQEVDAREEPSAPAAHSRVRIHRLRRIA
ncbi:MAG TPA: methyltransferase domain-containing protein [Longimicrobium sp.]|nr:methyltransferase domain-containing protein [Longimicrobium sp.]